MCAGVVRPIESGSGQGDRRFEDRADAADDPDADQRTRVEFELHVDATRAIHELALCAAEPGAIAVAQLPQGRGFALPAAALAPEQIGALAPPRRIAPAWRIGSYSGLVKGKAAVVYSSGGVYEAGSGAEAYDLMRPAFESWLGFIGLTDVSRITVAGTLYGPDAVASATAAATAQAEALAASF